MDFIGLSDVLWIGQIAASKRGGVKAKSAVMRDSEPGATAPPEATSSERAELELRAPFRSDRGVSHSAAGPHPPGATDYSRALSLAWPLRLETSRAPWGRNPRPASRITARSPAGVASGRKIGRAIRPPVRHPARTVFERARSRSRTRPE